MKEFISIDRLRRLRGVSIFNINYPAGYKARLKNGTPADTIVIILFGKVRCRAADGEVILTPDRVACFPRALERESEYLEDTHLISIHLDFEASEFAKFRRVFGVDELDSYQRTCLERLSEAASGKGVGELTVASCLYGLLEYLVGSSKELSAEEDAINQAKLRIENEFTNNIPITEYAAMINMSESSFRRYFQKYVGHPPAKYRQLLRLEYARHLISSGECSVDEAAERAGFCSLSYLCRQSKLYFGCTPSGLCDVRGLLTGSGK